MKKCKLHQWLIAGAVLAVAAVPPVAFAAAPLVLNTFDNAGDLGTWQANGTTLAWDGTQDAGGSSSVGCMKVLYDASTNQWGTQPQRTLGGQAFNSGQYWSVSFDFKIDPASAQTGSETSPYGHVQAIPVDSSWSWLPGIGWTPITTAFTNWQHLEIGFVPAYTDLNALVVQVGDGAFAENVIFYIDNLKVNPIPATYFFNQFTNSAEANQWGWVNWSQPGSNQWVASPDAGGSTPLGSLQIYNGFSDNPSNYQQVVFTKNVSFDPTRLTYLDVDVRVDPTSYLSADGAGYGDFTVFLEGLPNYYWVQVGSVMLTSTNWTRFSWPIPANITNSSKVVVRLGRGWSDASGGHGMTNSVIYYVDNLRVWRPQDPPTITKLQPATPRGANITMQLTGPANQWQRDAIVTPAGQNYLWYGQGEVSYSFTITNFPDAQAHPGFSAHIFIVNKDTIPGGGNFEETYGAADWNSADIVVGRLENNAGGGVDFSLRYKTNLPAANPNYIVTSLHAPGALGTWTLAFSDNTNVVVSGPGVSTNVSLPADVVERFNGVTSFLQFGAFKNDGAQSGINDGQSVTFSRVQVVGGFSPFDDDFAGPELTSNVAWRNTSDGAVSYSPEGVGYWLTWTLPDDGFSATVSSNVIGPYTDGGVFYSFLRGAARIGAIPATNMPAGNSAFFRLRKPIP